MGDIQLDVASANRFINSLSKSLQALCHGCMDFDAGIEIVGYINVNIDSGSKVDYVLNEKVLKSTTNSMTFVSNSFLAQKDQPKSCKDGSCSPIPELNIPSRNRGGGYPYPAKQLYRSSGIYSPHSQVLTGSQKRAWSGGDWRASPRKYQRGGKSQYASHQQQSSSYNESYSYSNQASLDPVSSVPSQQSSYTSQQEYEGSGQQSDINIKQEVEDSTGGNSGSLNTASEDSKNFGSDGLTDTANIKADPDSLGNQEGENTLHSENQGLDSSNSFLQPTKTDDEANSRGENEDNNETNYEDSSYNQEDSSSMADNTDNINEDSQGPSGVNPDYDGSGEAYPQSSYSAEASDGGSGQFEVIEIDDEDEDVAAMFDDPNYDGSGGARTHHHQYQNQYHSSYGALQGRESELPPLPNFYDASGLSPNHQCHICHTYHGTLACLKEHLCTEHRVELPFICKLCGKGFFSNPGLRQHMSSRHEGRKFQCHLCESKFYLKHHLKKHLRTVHKLF